MKSSVKLLRIVVMLLAVPFALAACSHAIGDNCLTSADCDPNGTRACDLSQPGGYCTIAGCDEKSCPSDSRCIRYFPEMFLSKRCIAAFEDLPCSEDPAAPCTMAGCKPEGCDDCTADEICLDVGLCAKRSFETRQCAKACGNDGDCRGGYECRPSGTHGSMLLSTDPLGTTGFCAPKSP